MRSAEGIYEDFSDFQAVLKRDGSIHWEPGGVFKTICTIDITYYPFDTQTCDLQYGAWSYYTSKMNLTTNITEVCVCVFNIASMYIRQSAVPVLISADPALVCCKRTYCCHILDEATAITMRTYVVLGG